MDGSSSDEDPSDYIKYLLSRSKKAQNQEEPKNLEFADNGTLLERKLVIPLPEDKKHCTIDIRKTQKMLGVLHMKYPEEKEGMDGSISDEDASDYMKYLLSMSKEAQHQEEPKNLDVVDNSLLVEQKLLIPLREDKKHCTVDIRNTQKMLVFVHRKYPEEKEGMDGSNSDEDASDYMKYLLSMSKEAQHQEEPKNVDVADNSSLVQRKLLIPLPEDEKHSTLDIRNTQKMLVFVHRKYPEEKEGMDGSNSDEDASDYMKYLLSMSKEAQHQEEPKNLDVADNSSLVEQKLLIPLPEDEKHCTVDIRNTQKMLGVVHRKYPEEKEGMDGSISDEDPSDYMKYLLSLSKEAQHQEETKNLDVADNSLLVEQKPVTPLSEDEKHCIVDIRKTQEMLEVLHMKYPEEKEAVIHTRNQWGKAFSEILPLELERTPQELLVQAVLEKWMDWTTVSRSRESPHSYKCYICNNGWWSLTEFTTHITNHLDCNLQIETRQQECNIVAYGTEGLVYKEIDIHGKCLKCAKTYDHHQSNKRRQDSFYYCNYCDKRFQTCRTVAKHEGSCPWNPVRILASSDVGKDSSSEFSCEVCHTVFMSKPSMSRHMLICHTVRSDEPIVNKVKVCGLCEQKYCNFNFHACLKKHVKYECKHCSAKFHNKVMLDHHLKMWAGVYQCRVCDKFLQKPCMAAEHYVLHSEHFLSVIRCLECQKIKVFMSEDAWRTHRTKYHRRYYSSRPNYDKIIMARIMLEQCMVEPVKRMYVSVHRNRAAPQETPSQNTTIAYDDTVTLGTEEPSENNPVHVKVEKDYISEKEVNECNKILEDVKAETKKVSDDSKVPKSSQEIENIKSDDNEEVSENLQEVIENKQQSEMLSEDFTEKIIKTEKNDAETDNTNDKIETEKGRRDISNIMEEFSEFLDIKPDIIIKEESMSEDEATEISSTEISKGFQASRTFAEEVTANSEHSKEFQPSESILESSDIKQEVKKEPVDDNDLMILDPSDDLSKNNSGSSKNSEVISNLEPEAILKAGYRKIRIYRCNKCDFTGFHREYKKHINSHCNKAPKEYNTDGNYKCTKCNKGYPNLKMYALHFEKHGYRYRSCPQCKTGFDSVKKLVTHVNSHIKNQFFRVQLLNNVEGTDHCKVYQCKTCGEVVSEEQWFVHWEKHPKLMKEPLPKPPPPKPPPTKPPLENFKVRKTGNNVRKIGIKVREHALNLNLLKEVLVVLTAKDRSSETISKPCIVCSRVFKPRRSKPHLIQHLLEDAYANIVKNQMLKCQICSDLHKKPHGYKKHMRDHASLPTYKCGLCNKTFGDSSNYSKHKKIHNLKAFICDICNKKFQAKFCLEKHIQMHMVTDPITCDRCQKVFQDRSFYKQHVRQHHEKVVSHRCMVCREKFTSVREKWDHMWLVHKQRKAEADCPICGVSYRKFNDVKKHAYVEHGKQITLTNLLILLSKSKVRETEARIAPNVQKEVVPVIRDSPAVPAQKEAVESSDDDCLLIEND